MRLEMESSILIARILAAVYLSAALGAFLDRGYLRRIAEDMHKNAALVYLITFVGWSATVKGVLIIAFPGEMRRWSERFLTELALTLFPFVALALGLLFAFFGFVR